MQSQHMQSHRVIIIKKKKTIIFDILKKSMNYQLVLRYYKLSNIYIFI